MTDTATTTTTAEDKNDASASGFTALQIVTASCHGILNTILTTPDPKPDWFDELSGNLDTAKVLANQWIDDLAPQLTASIPNHIIDYGTTYNAITDQIVGLLDENPTAKGKDDPTVQQVFALINALDESLASILKDIDATSETLKKWGDDMQTAHDKLFNGAASIQESQIKLQNHIDSMNNAISTLRAEIDAQNKALIAGAAAVAGGVFTMAIGIALAPVSGGASLVVGGIGAAAVIGGAVTWGVMQSKIDDNFDKISDDQAAIAEDERQLAALNGLALGAGTAIDSIASATSALSGVRTLWATFQGEIKGTQDKLEKADEELMAIVNKAFVIAAQKEWTLAIEFAQKLTGMSVSVETKEVSMKAQEVKKAS